MQMTTAERTGANVRAEMARRGMSQVALAGLLGISQSMLSARLAGKTVFNIDELHRVATALDVPLGVLLADHPATT